MKVSIYSLCVKLSEALTNVAFNINIADQGMNMARSGTNNGVNQASFHTTIPSFSKWFDFYDINDIEKEFFP